MDLINDIDKHITLINDSIRWSEKFGKDTFPVNSFKEYRRQLRKMRAALSENCSAAAYGQSQVGKSYLMSNLLSSPDSPFEIENKGRAYSFIDEINPSGGNQTQVESTGVITRFTLTPGNPAMKDFVKVKLLSVVDIILLIADSYYNDIKIDSKTILTNDAINRELEARSVIWKTSGITQNYLVEDDVKDICEYIECVIGNNASQVFTSKFCATIAPVIQSVPCERWVDIFSLLWNKNREMSELLSTLISAYKKLNFKTDVYVPFDCFLIAKGTILKIDWLDTVCGVKIDTGKDEVLTNIYDKDGNLLIENFEKGNLSALIAELTFVLPQSVAAERSFLKDIDLLDFPGARARENYKESEIKPVLPKILRRGKVAYLFNKYSRSLLISSVLFCHHNDQKGESSMGESINSWIDSNIGKTSKEREAFLRNTNGVAPLFMIATKFNIDLTRSKTDTPENTATLDEHWKRFDKVIPEIIKPSEWFDNWIPGKAFTNVFPLRDFYWSSKNQLFTGYSDGAVKSEEKELYKHEDYPNYWEALRRSFLRNEFAQKHFDNPQETWDSVATLNNDGSKPIIAKLSKISGVLDQARHKKYLEELQSVKDDMMKTLNVYFEPEDEEKKNQKVKQLSGDIHRSLVFNIGSKPEIFGKIIDSLMVPVGRLRSIAYDIIVCHTEMPKDFTKINFYRALAGIDPTGNREENIKKLCDYFSCDVDTLKKDLKSQNCTIDEILSPDIETLATVAGVVTKHILDYWVEFLNERAKTIETILPHSDEVIFMLIALMKKMRIKDILREKIDSYTQKFESNEQPNAIADFASLTLNNFVSNIGRNYISDDELDELNQKAAKCGIKIDTSSDTFAVARKPLPVLDTLEAFDEATREINNTPIDISLLRRLPFWENFLRWQNLVTIGLIYSSDISKSDPVANAEIKALLDICQSLYN